MKMNENYFGLLGMDTVILAGGLGTRLQSVLKDKPKCLAPINGKPFIDILIDDCKGQGLNRFIICVGHQKEQVIKHLCDRVDCEIVFSEEEKPLGTGGALKKAEPYIISNPFIVLNGDSFCEISYQNLSKFHLRMNAFITIVISKVKDGRGYGRIILDEKKRIIEFCEKGNFQKENLANAGIYCMNKSALDAMSVNTSFSLEKDFFPKILDKKILTYQIQSTFFDIGTPGRLEILKNYHG